jgi:TonB-dependent receptor
MLQPFVAALPSTGRGNGGQSTAGLTYLKVPVMSRRTVYSPLVASMVSILVLGAGAAHADDAAVDNTGGAANALDEVTVQAQRTTTELARRAQFQAPNLINLTTAAEIAKLPDVNTGEAVRRIPGISLETDTGEGRYINIRGLDADLNSTTFGGLRLPPTNNSSPSGSARAVAFDSIPIGFVGAIKVTKSNLPEQDAEALGGTIDITPKTAPSDGRPFAEIKAGSGYEPLRGSGIVDLAVTAGTRFGGAGGYDPFSVLVTGSMYNDGRGIDDAEAAFVDNQPTTPDKAFAGFEQRYYQYHRKRHGYGIDLGYQPDDANSYFARYYDAGYNEAVLRNRLEWNFNGPSTVNPANPNGFLDTVNFTKTLRDEKEYLDSKVFEVGGKNRLGDNTLDYHVGYTRGTYYKPYDYSSNFDNPNTANAAYDNTTTPDWPVVTTLPGTPLANGTVTVNPADPSGYTLTKITNQVTHSDDHEWGIGTNLTLPTSWTSRADEQLKFGLNARLRTKTADQQSFKLTAVPSLTLAQASTGGPVTYYDKHYQNGPNINPDSIEAIWAQNLGSIQTDPVATQLNNVHDKENIYAAYGQYQFGYGALGIVAGLRMERTQATYAGFQEDQSGAAPIVTPVSTDRSYTNLFPSAQLRYEFSPDLIGRAALSSTIARPGFQQVTATTVVDPGGNVTTGNPKLNPTTAHGLDLAIEQYLPHAGILSAGFFAKQIQDYIVTNVQQVAGGAHSTAGNLGLLELISYANAPSARLFGLEFNYVQKFRDLLPGPLAGLGVAANWTWVDSRYRVPVADASGNTTLSRDSVLPSTSRNTANAELTYERNGLNLSLAAYYTSRNIFGMGSTAALDQWTQDRFSVDFGSMYQVSAPFSVYFTSRT